MKKVVIISSTPRAGGNSEVLAKEFERGALESGHQVEFVALRDHNFKYCTGCYSCHKIGKCVIDDGINEVSQKLLDADVIVFATPVYFYSMSGWLKVFIDRLTPIYEKVRADIYMIATQWDPDKQIMENTFEAIRGLTKYCFEGCEEKGLVYGADLSELGAAANNPQIMKTAFEMGKNI